MTSLQVLYSAACKAYGEKLNEMWDIDGEWLGDYTAFEALEYILTNEEMRCVVDNGISFEDFREWYEYDSQVSYGRALKKAGAKKITLAHWLKGVPESRKVPQETREQWEREYINMMLSR